MSAVKKGVVKEQQAKFVLGLVKGTLDYNDFKHADMVIEAALEDIPLKVRRVVLIHLSTCHPCSTMASHSPD